VKTRIIAFDPGGTTGIAMVTLMDNPEPEFGFDRPEPFTPQFLVEQLGPMEHHVELEDFLAKYSEGVDRYFIVYESFEFRNTSRAGTRLDSKEYIGTIKTWAKRRGYPLFSQTPAQGKSFVSDQVLKDLNLYSKAFRHANDGMRHLIYFAVNNTKFKFNAMPYEIAFRAQLLDLGFRT